MRQQHDMGSYAAPLPPAWPTCGLAALNKNLLHVRSQQQAAAMLLHASHQRIHHCLTAAAGKLKVAVWAVPAHRQAGSSRQGEGWDDGCPAAPL